MDRIFKNFPQWEFKFGHVNFSDLGIKESFLLKRGSLNFYDASYSIFFQKIKSYEAYPDYFKRAKRATALSIEKFVKNKKVISLGCGSAYVENIFFPSEDITLSDSSLHASKLSSRKIYPPSHIKKDKWDVVLAIQLVFHLDEEELGKLFCDVTNNLKNNGIFVFTHSPKPRSFFHQIFILARTMGKIIFLRKRKYVLWGWRRSDDFYNNLARDYGLKTFLKKENIENKESILFMSKQ